MDRDMYYNLVFMSATPHVALLGAIKEAGIRVTELTGTMHRQKKRWIVRGEMRTMPERIPDNTILYSTMPPP